MTSLKDLAMSGRGSTHRNSSAGGSARRQASSDRSERRSGSTGCLIVPDLLSQAIAALVYFPAAGTGLLMEKPGLNIDRIPLSQYRRNSFYTMWTNALEHFGTRLEKRFTKAEIQTMMENCGLKILLSVKPHFGRRLDIAIKDRYPNWIRCKF